MPAAPKILLPGTTIFVSSRIQEGLPLVASMYMRAILEGILARSQQLFGVTICHYVFMSNHLHLIMVVKDPDMIPAFMNRLKTESAHAINKLLGRVQRSIWCPGYDSPVLLTPTDVISKIAYTYTNPQTAGLVNKIDEFPGLSSWDMFMNNRGGFVAKWIHRYQIKKLAKTNLTTQEQGIVSNELLSESREIVEFRLEPNAWMDAFGINDPAVRSDFNRQIVECVRAKEIELEDSRNKNGRTVIGQATLKAQPIDTPHTPRKFSPKSRCICHIKSIKIAFLLIMKGEILEAKRIRDRWKMGDFSERYPLGLFPPRVPRLGNLLPSHFEEIYCYENTKHLPWLEG